MYVHTYPLPLGGRLLMPGEGNPLGQSYESDGHPWPPHQRRLTQLSLILTFGVVSVFEHYGDHLCFKERKFPERLSLIISLAMSGLRAD
jgi:hypothetical protein